MLTITTDFSDPPPQTLPSTLSSRRFFPTRPSSYHKMNKQVPPLPPLLRLSDDLLLQIYESVDQPELKSMRLMCRKITSAATTSLFSHIHVKSNMGSFCRLHTICLYPEFSKIVKEISYSGKMLSTTDATSESTLTFDDWYEFKIGAGLRKSRKVAAVQYFKATLRANQRKYHYQKYHEHVHSQRHSRKSGLEFGFLFAAFRALPSLQSICVECGMDNAAQPYHPDFLNQLSQIGRETLVEPDSQGGYRYHGRQVPALLGAASKARKHLQVIELRGLRWEAFRQSEASLVRMIDAAKHCHRFACATVDSRDIYNGRAVIAKIIAGASLLTTLEISLGSLSRSCGDHLLVVGLDSLLHANCSSHLTCSRPHWPHLRRLKLGAMHTSEMCLRKFLTAHTSTLRSLALAHIYITGKHGWPKSRKGRGSWLSIILSLERDLRLDRLRLDGKFSNHWDEAWTTHDPDEDEHWAGYGRSQNRPLPGVSLKHRVERFVVSGGDFPLSPPKSTFWAASRHPHEWFGRNIQGDASWRFCPQFLSSIQ